MSGEAAEKTEELSGEDLIQQALGGEPEPTPEAAPEPREYSAIEKEAMDMGNWLPKEDWIEANPDKDPEIWSTAKDFVKYGKLKSEIGAQNAEWEQKYKGLKHHFDDRIEGLNKLHQAQLDTKIAELVELQDIAVSEADVDGYKRAGVQIKSLQDQKDSTPTPANNDDGVAAKSDAQVEWEKKNTWIDDEEDIRSAAAIGAWNSYLAKNQNATVEDALKHVDKMVAKISPPTNPLRDAAPTTETTPRPAPRGKSRALTMSDLNQDERDMWRHTGSSMWGGDEAKYLKACTDARKGA